MLIQQLEIADCRKELIAASFGRLACAFENQPYVVPVYFVVDPEHVHQLYLFSMPGHKIEWMRINPLVCVQIDAVHERNDWTSIIAFGRYEGAPDAPHLHADRHRALELLQTRKMWWEPGAIGITGRNDRDGGPEPVPVYYRINIERMTGHRAAPARIEKILAARPGWTLRGWVRSIFASPVPAPHC